MADDRVTVEIETEGSEAVETFDDLAEASKGADKSIDKVNKQIKGLSKSKAIITSVKSSVLSFGKGALAVAASVGAIGLAAIGAVKAIGAMTDSVRSIQEADRAFQLKGGEQGIEVLRRIQDYGHQAGLGLDNVNKIAKKLADAFDPTSAETLMQIIGDSRARGADVEKLGDAFAELGGKTKMSQGDMEGWFNATGMAAPSIEQISKASGKTFDEVSKALEKGELATQDFILGVDQANKELLKTQKTGEGGLKFSTTDARSNLTRISDSIEAVKMSLMQRIGQTGLGNVLKNIADAVDKFVASGGIESVINTVVSSFKALMDMLSPLGSVFTALQEHFKKMSGYMKEMSSGSSGASSSIKALKAVVTVLSSVLTVAVKMISLTAGAILSVVSAVANLADAMGIIDFVTRAATAYQQLPDIIASVFSTVTSLFKSAIDFIMSSVNGILNIGSIFLSAGQSVISAVTSMASTVGGLIGSMVSSLLGTFTALPSSLSPLVSSVLTSITSPLLQLPQMMLDIGKNIMDGLFNGLTSGIEKIKSAVSSVTGAIKGVFTSDLQIHSPSKLTTNYGKFVDEGTAIGMTENVDKVEKAASTVTDTIASSFDSGAASPQIGSTGSSTTNNMSVPIGINVSIATAGSAAPNIDTNTLSSLIKQVLVGYIESSAT